MARDEIVSREQLVRQLHELGVRAGDVLLVHTSFRAVRPVEGGPSGLIDALQEALGADGTLTMPAWTEDDDHVFHPGTTPAAQDLGVVADTFWRMPGVLRSRHPFAFAAAGKHAAQLLQDAMPIPPHIPESPVGRVLQLDGKVLLLGVDHDADTTLHLAEWIADVPYRIPRYCTVEREGKPVRLHYRENDHCCERFRLCGEWLAARGLEHRGRVGHAMARLARARDIVAEALEHLHQDRLVFLHAPGEGCTECDEARASIAGPV